jgi:hypothetical protein
MTTITTTPLPTTSNNQFSLPPEWINNEMQMMRRVEHLQAAIVELSRNAMQIITWSEMIQEGIDEMQKSLSTGLPTLETEPEPEPEETEEDKEEEENNVIQ